jgi:hypothetical protein
MAVLLDRVYEPGEPGGQGFADDGAGIDHGQQCGNGQGSFFNAAVSRQCLVASPRAKTLFSITS